MRELLTARAALVELVGELEPTDAANLLRGLADELAPTGITNCSGWYSAYCQVHGECSCSRPWVVLGDAGCPLHEPDSAHDATHAPATTAPKLSGGEGQ